MFKVDICRMCFSFFLFKCVAMVTKSLSQVKNTLNKCALSIRIALLM